MGGVTSSSIVGWDECLNPVTSHIVMSKMLTVWPIYVQPSVLLWSIELASNGVFTMDLRIPAEIEPKLN